MSSTGFVERVWSSREADLVLVQPEALLTKWLETWTTTVGLVHLPVCGADTRESCVSQTGRVQARQLFAYCGAVKQLSRCVLLEIPITVCQRLQGVTVSSKTWVFLLFWDKIHCAEWHTATHSTQVSSRFTEDKLLKLKKSSLLLASFSYSDWIYFSQATCVPIITADVLQVTDVS